MSRSPDTEKPENNSYYGKRPAVQRPKTAEYPIAICHTGLCETAGKIYPAGR